MRWTYSIQAVLVSVLAVQLYGAVGEIEDKGHSETVSKDYKHASAEAYEAWKDRKFGMRVHWGMYNVLGFDASWPLRSERPRRD